MTPNSFILERDHDYVLTITKEGYETQTVQIVHVISGAEAGNLLGFGFVGLGIDLATGSAWRLNPDTIVVSLKPLSPAEKVTEEERLNSATLQTKLHSLVELRDDNVLTDTEYQLIRNITIHCVSDN